MLGSVEGQILHKDNCVIPALTNKALLISPLIVLMISCGKKVEEGSSAEVTLAGANLPAAVTLEASATGSTSRKDHYYEIIRDGNVEIPTMISSTSTVTGIHRMRLDVNLVSGEEEFHCFWVGRGNRFEFDSCKDYDGNDLGLNLTNISRFKFPIDQGKHLRLSLETAPTGTTVKGRLELAVNWI